MAYLQDIAMMADFNLVSCCLSEYAARHNIFKFLLPQKPIMKVQCLWDNCKEQFTKEELRLEHLKHDHITKETTKCKWGDCGFIGTSRWNIISHIYIHLKIVSATCFLCNKSFKRRNEYKMHYKSHSTNEKVLDKMARFLLETPGNSQ